MSRSEAWVGWLHLLRKYSLLQQLCCGHGVLPCELWDLSNACLDTSTNACPDTSTNAGTDTDSAHSPTHWGTHRDPHRVAGLEDLCTR